MVCAWRTVARREWRELEGDREGSWIWIEIRDCGRGGSAASLGIAGARECGVTRIAGARGSRVDDCFSRVLL